MRVFGESGGGLHACIERLDRVVVVVEDGNDAVRLIYARGTLGGGAGLSMDLSVLHGGGGADLRQCMAIPQ